MEKMTNPNCVYVDPDTGAGCTLVGKNEIYYPHEGSNYCIHHLPLPPDEKASISKIPIEQMKEQLARIAAIQIKQYRKVQMRGVHFVCDPLTH